MGDSGLILGVSGLRGIVGESLTPEVAVRYAGAFGSWLREREGDPVRVGLAADGRMGWQSIHAAAMTGLLASGCDVVDLGVLATPTVGNAVDSFGLDAAIQVTASHNPQEWNGLKCIVCESTTEEQRVAAGDPDPAAWLDRDPTYVLGARAPTSTEAAEIIAQYQSSEAAWESNRSVGTTRQRSDAIEGHVEDVIFGVTWMDRWENFSAIVDSVNGSGTRLVEVFSAETGLKLVQLAGAESGIFPHTPEPTKENLSGEGGLCDAVPGLKADIGFAQDPDADRLAIVDERGEYIGEEYTMVLCAMALMEARMGDDNESSDGKPVFVVNLSTSRMIDDVARHYGCEVIRTAVGEANVVEAMKSLTASGRDVVLGGEGNGGVIWPKVTYVRDSLSGMALVLSLMARTGKTVSGLVSMINAMGPTEEVRSGGYTIIKKKSALASKADAVPVVEHLEGIYGGKRECRVDLQDGIRIDWDDRGVWAHVRASNTEPIMRVIVEAPSEREAEAIAAEIDGEIARMGKGQ